MSRQTAIPASPCADAERILPGYQFADAYKVQAIHGINAIESTRMAFAHMPLWMRVLMGMRNRLGRLVGLKSAAGGFPVVRESPDQVILGFDDKHLDFRVVVGVGGGFATVTTIVRWHNAWGRAYLAAIMPFHRAIAARVIEGVA
jgi:hypothetical protein